MHPKFARRVLLGVAGLIVLTGIVARIWLSKPSRPAEVLKSDLVLVDGRLCRKGQTNAFSGILIERYKDGLLKSRSQIVRGVLHGLSEGWYPNGQLQIREPFEQGLSHGIRTKWYENGVKMSEARVLQSKLQGVFRRWDENGRLAEQIELNDGQPNGLSFAFFPSGSLKARAELRMGEVVQRTTWNDGEMTAPPEVREP